MQRLCLSCRQKFMSASVEDEKGLLGILSIQTTEGMLDLALDLTTADAIVNAVQEIRSKLDPES